MGLNSTWAMETKLLMVQEYLCEDQGRIRGGGGGSWGEGGGGVLGGQEPTPKLQMQHILVLNSYPDPPFPKSCIYPTGLSVFS